MTEKAMNALLDLVVDEDATVRRGGGGSKGRGSGSSKGRRGDGKHCGTAP